MTPLWTSADLVAATGGTVARPFAVTGISIDTRELSPGDLFVALRDVRDGHDFVAQALQAGAAAALVSRIPEGVPADAPLVIVPDVLAALEAMARFARARTTAKVIGVTGSVGKTSTKEMLRAILSGQGKTHAAEKSFNNHWGVPLTLARMPADAAFGVIEIGMNHPGEIAPLAILSDLDVAIITTVAPAHLEAFQNVEAIAVEKAAIFQGLRPGGIAIVNGDLATTPVLLAHAPGTAKTFGRAEGADFRLISATLAQDVTIVRAEIEGQRLIFKISSPGAHFAMNALAALAAARAVGADIGLAACDMGHWLPPHGRGTRERILLDIVDDHLTFDLIDDAFNANPASMAAALDVLAAAEPTDNVGRHARGRRIAILGDMLELGPTEIALHRDIALLPATAALHTIHCVGPRAHALWVALPAHQRGLWVEQATDLLPRLRSLVDAGDVVLVKGSKGIKVSLLVDALRKLSQSRADQKGVL